MRYDNHKLEQHSRRETIRVVGVKEGERKCNFACKRPKSKMKILIVRCTRNQMSRNVHHRTRESFPVPNLHST